ncbi:MAG: Asp-tRNA(Asn)/Glu-tRNA(Gln) amidotransferase subunit GatC [Parvularculales bacterium]
MVIEDREMVRHIAHLARLTLPDDALDAMALDIVTILEWVRQLEEVDTEGVQPMTAVFTMDLPMRKDKVTDGGDRRQVLANAPAVEDGFFTTPKIVE